jgi:crotonobetaine/carnitine-CoA ligase
MRAVADAAQDRPGVDRAATIPGLLQAAAADDPDSGWLHIGDEVWSRREIAARAACAAGALHALGVGPGDRVCIVAGTSADLLSVWFGGLSLGAVLASLNPGSTPTELAGLVEQVRPAVIVADPDGGTLIRTATSRTYVTLGDLLGGTTTAALPAMPVAPGDPAVLIPTSGTTGKSKLVVQTHRGYVLAAQGFPAWLGLTSTDRMMTSLPMFHVNAPAYSVLGSLAAGASLALLPRFSAGGFLDSARRYGATQFNAIGAMLELIMRQPARPDDADTSLRICYAGPAPDRDRHLQIEQRLGIRLMIGYGMSETTYGTVWPLSGPRPYGTLGRLRQHPTLGTINEGRVVGEDGHPVAPGGVGELLLSNPATMLGYYGMPAETAEVLVDGWLHTGDLVRPAADGTLTYVARRKAVLRRRGENYAPLEVEEAIRSHPAVLDVAVVGVPSELSDEDGKAFVVVRPGDTVDPAQLWQWTRDRLSAFKVPRYVEFVDELPLTPTGRVATGQLPRVRTPAEHDLGALERKPGRQP